MSVSSVQQTAAVVALLCICLELLDVFTLVIAGCKRALHTQFEPCVVSGGKAPESYLSEGRRRWRSDAQRRLVLVSRS